MNVFRRAFRRAHTHARINIRIHLAHGRQPKQYRWLNVDLDSSVIVTDVTGLPHYVPGMMTSAGRIAWAARESAEWWLAEHDMEAYLRIRNRRSLKTDRIRERAKLAATEAA